MCVGRGVYYGFFFLLTGYKTTQVALLNVQVI